MFYISVFSNSSTTEIRRSSQLRTLLKLVVVSRTCTGIAEVMGSHPVRAQKKKKKKKKKISGPTYNY